MKEICDGCCIAFALAEERIENKHGTFHEDCERTRERRHRLREMIIKHAIQTGTTLHVVPRHLGRQS